ARTAKEPVLLFSLEMSHIELTQRLVSAESRVDSSRIRSGKLTDADWQKISHAIGRLSETKIYIDDNPDLTILDIRSRARRLKAREGLSLVVIDYLQLMSGRRGAESRQVEVSEISRGLKILARQLDVPVVALSQLSRNLEARHDRRPQLADLRESGCVTADTLVTLSDSSTLTIAEMLNSGWVGRKVLAFDGRGVVSSELINIFETGVKETFTLTTKSGLSIRATANHPFYTVQGWRRLDQLESGVELAVLVDDRIVWDQMVETTSAGQEVCYDLTVRDTHCFFGNTMLVHNSLEQDADIVMFIYRDEVYAPDSVDRGTAEVIVAKHRNGPTGVARLAFLSHCTLFTSLAKIDGH
ncbi:MAG: AAA family ATPase, partial [Acidimicrobiaceae bacterium]|nr:AAA family ATPase [Acidimicrobiaceae bacterium]